ncbi:MAG: hypothetical protein FWG45_07020, partial [Oscillospiraceae bacterium]|nr:hypothetical protein [Oscillospiraceae bacterium]
MKCRQQRIRRKNAKQDEKRGNENISPEILVYPKFSHNRLLTNRPLAKLKCGVFAVNFPPDCVENTRNAQSISAFFALSDEKLP